MTTPRLHKTLKVSSETHQRIRILAAQRGVSMAQLVDDTIGQRWQYYDAVAKYLTKAVK